MKRDYYSVRTGKIIINSSVQLGLLKRHFLIDYNSLEKAGYFQKYFGYDCVDSGYVEGELGSDIPDILFVSIKKENLWPIREKIENYSIDDLLDIIEFIYDYCSKPLDGFFHSWGECGWHYKTFDDKLGQEGYRRKINLALKDYDNGFELSDKGEILILPDKNIFPIFHADLPTKDVNILSRVESASQKFRKHKSTIDDRKEAIRELVDILEYLRPKAKKHLLKEDESDLFNIANNFGIRHYNSKQKVNYNKGVWYSWMFYFYLSTIHALLRIIKENEETKSAKK